MLIRRARPLCCAGSRWWPSTHRPICSSSRVLAAKDPVALGEAIRHVMRLSAQPVALVSAFVPSEDPDDPSPHIHSTTLSSFTTVSLAPPIVAFSIRLPSRMADALLSGAKTPPPSNNYDATSVVSTFARKPHFLIHILSSKQTSMSNFFARPGAKPYSLRQSTKIETHPFNQHPMQPSQAVDGQLIPSESIGTLACSLVYQLDLTSPDLHGTTEFVNGCVHTNEVGSALFLAQIHDVEVGHAHINDVKQKPRPLVYWHHGYCTTQEDSKS
mgnify:FL=1